MTVKNFQIDLIEFARFLNLLKFIVPNDLEAYERTLLNIDNQREKIARSFYILDYYDRSTSIYTPEFKQNFTFYSKKQWFDVLKLFGFEVEFGIHRKNQIPDDTQY